MKVTELMIGDWVNIHGENWRATLATLQLAYDNSDIIKPIPLTVDILEKNGFVRCGEDSLYPQYNDCTHRFSDNRGHVVLLEYIGWNHGYYNVHDITTIHDVHELQHIFKIKKIKKEIVL